MPVSKKKGTTSLPNASMPSSSSKVVTEKPAFIIDEEVEEKLRVIYIEKQYERGSEQGCSIKEMACQLGVSERTVRHWFERKVAPAQTAKRL